LTSQEFSDILTKHALGKLRLFACKKCDEAGDCGGRRSASAGNFRGVCPMSEGVPAVNRAVQNVSVHAYIVWTVTGRIKYPVCFSGRV
jgi:hypothetical protein